MTSIARFALAGSAALLLGACTATMGRAPIDVTRYHLGSPIPPGSVALEPIPSGAQAGPEFDSYAGPVGAELTRLGYGVAADPSSTYVAAISLTRSFRGTVRERPPVTIGLGGGSYSGGYRGGVGVGGGLSFGIGGKKRNVIVSDLGLQLKRRADGGVVWEGHAITEALQGTEENQPAAVATRLAHALFQGFPGESGVTITVK